MNKIRRVIGYAAVLSLCVHCGQEGASEAPTPVAIGDDGPNEPVASTGGSGDASSGPDQRGDGAGDTGAASSDDGDPDPGSGSGSTGDEEPLVAGAVICDAAAVQTIFDNSCSAAGCHGGAVPAAALDLSGTSGAEQLVSVEAALCDGWTRIVPGQPEASLLYQKLAGPPPAGCGVQMPIGVSLGETDLSCIASWIENMPLESSDPDAMTPDCETCGGSACVDLRADANHCGACDAACPPGTICVEGACDCPASISLTTDPDNCGACGARCAPGQNCQDGVCTCDSSAASFETVSTILEQHCAGGGCHSGARPREGLSLQRSDAWSGLVNVPASQCQDGRSLVSPGSPDTSYLMDKILGTNLCSGSRMPKAGMGLPSADIDAISAWICAGANM